MGFLDYIGLAKKKDTVQKEAYVGIPIATSGYNVGDTVMQERQASALLEDIRSANDIGEKIEIISKRDPDVSMAVYGFTEYAYQGIEIEIHDINGVRNKEWEKEFNNECANWNVLANDGLDGIVKNLQKTGLLYNIMMIEVVVTKKSQANNTIDGIYIIDPRTVEWKLEDRDGATRWIPYQNQQGSSVDLTKGNVFWVVANPDISTPTGGYLLEPAVMAVDYKLQTLLDTSAVLRKNGYPYHIVSVDLQSLIQNIPQEIKGDPKKLNEYIEQTMRGLNTTFSNRQPTQDIVTVSSVKVENSANGAANGSIDMGAFTKSVDIQILNGCKTLGILLNRVQGSTETWGTVELKIFNSFVSSYQRNSKRLIESGIGAIWLQIKGYQGKVSVTHKSNDFYSELQRENIESKRIQNVVSLHNQRYISADTAVQKLDVADNAEQELFDGSTIGVTISGTKISPKDSETNS